MLNVGKVAKRFALILVQLVRLALASTHSTLPVKCQASEYCAMVHVSSPIQDETYYTNAVPLKRAQTQTQILTLRAHTTNIAHRQT